MPPVVTALIFIGIALILLAVMGYVKAPPDQAYIISGLRRKIVVGKAAIRIPFLERLGPSVAFAFDRVIDVGNL